LEDWRWLADRLIAAMGPLFSLKTCILEPVGCFFAYLGHHFGGPWVQGDTQWSH
jgi:hypothetical protein